MRLAVLSLQLLLFSACVAPPLPHPVAQPAGCPVQVFWGADTPPGITDPKQYWYFRDAQIACGKGEPKATCLRRLQDQACAVGAELIYVVEESPSLVAEGTVFYGKRALRR